MLCVTFWSFNVRVEDAEGCFILTDRYADDREAAVCWTDFLWQNVADMYDQSYLTCVLSYTSSITFNIKQEKIQDAGC